MGNMVGLGTTLLVSLSTPLCLYLLLTLIRFLHRVWWTPIHIQHVLWSQGIKGPPYRFIHGNTREIFKMRKESMGKSMDLSHDIYPRILPHTYSWAKIYGKTHLHWYGPKAQLVVTDPELAKDILYNREKAYKKFEPEGYLKKLFGDGLVFSEGEKWVKLRKLANHAFHSDRLKNMTPAMTASVEIMLERWKRYEGKEVEVYEEFRLLTSEVISRVAFGSSYIEGKDIFEMLRKLSTMNARNSFQIRLPGLSKLIKTADEVESDKLEQGIRESIIGIIDKREKMVMTGGAESYGTDYLGSLVKTNHDADENNRITVEDVIDECKTFYIAGQETTGTLLSWSVLLLAIHTDWQDKARQEVLHLFGMQHPDFEGIGRLKVMSMIINESLRLYPPALSLLRKVKCEVKLGKFLLPANVNLVVPTVALHHDSQLWGEDAHLFKPERFSEGVAKATNDNPSVFIPFGLGPRTCVGMNFAMNETKIALSMILQRYSFTLSPSYVHSPGLVVTICPQQGVQVILRSL